MRCSDIHCVGPAQRQVSGQVRRGLGEQTIDRKKPQSGQLEQTRYGPMPVGGSARAPSNGTRHFGRQERWPDDQIPTRHVLQ